MNILPIRPETDAGSSAESGAGDAAAPVETTAVDVAEVLGDAIIFGRLAPGTRRAEDHRIARFEATRHCIRQRLNELERTGTVVREMPHRQAVLRIPLPAPKRVVKGTNSRALARHS